LILRARIFVLTAGPPAFAARGWLLITLRAQIGHRVFRRIPQLAALEPLHHAVGLRALQLLQRRNQIFRVARAKRRRL